MSILIVIVTFDLSISDTLYKLRMVVQFLLMGLFDH